MHESCIGEKKSGQNWKLLFSQKGFLLFFWNQHKTGWLIWWSLTSFVADLNNYLERSLLHSFFNDVFHEKTLSFFLSFIVEKVFRSLKYLFKKTRFLFLHVSTKEILLTIVCSLPEIFLSFFFHFLINPQSKFPSISRETRLMGKNSFIFHLLY